MNGRVTWMLALVVLVATALTGVVVATPPTDEDNGLTANESATLWSRDDDSGYITNAEYRDVYGDSRSAMAELANATDITFTRPPATASTWSANDHADFVAGGIETSLAPRGANRTDGRIIRDAHVSVFDVSPATVLHEAAGEQTLYVAPTGTVRAVVDYRVPLGNGTTRSLLLDHRIEEVRLLADEEVVARANGSHRPVFTYDVDPGVEQLTVEANLTVRVEAAALTVTNASTVSAASNASDVPTLSDASNESDASNTSDTSNASEAANTSIASDGAIVEETLTVRDSQAVEVYTLNSTLRTAVYPSGETGVAIFQTDPWQGYSFGNESRVRGVWRFYTARNTDWDELIAHRRVSAERIPSDSIPVTVHAYPSRLGPQVRPTGSGIDLLQTWGTTNDPPATLGEGILADVVEQPYETTWGVATRQERIGESVTVHGIVRGTNATLATNGTTQEIREADLTLDVVDRTEEAVTLVATLRDGETGRPLALESVDDGPFTSGGEGRAGYLTVEGQVVETNSSGMARVTIPETGTFTARYHPESWVSQTRAYTSATATARYHPLTTADGWLWLAIDGVVWLAPFLLALFAGRTLSRLFNGTKYT